MFNPKIATDMAIYFLKKLEGKDKQNYLKILHLMYLAERENIRVNAEPLCGDDMFSTPLDPILSKTLDLMEERIPLPVWTNKIKFVEIQTIDLVDPSTEGYGQISRADRQIFDEVWETHKNRTWQEMRDWMMENCPEWDKRASVEGYPNRISIGLDALLDVFALCLMMNTLILCYILKTVQNLRLFKHDGELETKRGRSKFRVKLIAIERLYRQVVLQNKYPIG